MIIAMKATLIFLLPLLCRGAVVQHELHRRQGPGVSDRGSASNLLQKPVSVESLNPSIQRNAVKKQLIWGPFKLQPADGTREKSGMPLKLDRNSQIISTPIGGFCTNCMVLSANAEISDSKGVKVDGGSGVNSHYIVVTDIGHPMVVPPIRAGCANGKFGGYNFGGMAMEAPNGSGSMADGNYEIKSASSKESKESIDVGAQRPPPKSIGKSFAPKASTSLTPKALSTSSVAKASSTSSVPKVSSAASALATSSVSSTTTTSSASSATSPAAIPGLDLLLEPGMADLATMLAPTIGAIAGGIFGAAAMAGLGVILGAAFGALAGSSLTDSGVAALLVTRFSSIVPSISVFISQGDKGSGLTYAAKGEDLKSGFWVSSEDQFHMTTEITNNKDVEQDIYVKIEYEYIPNLENRPSEYYDVGMGAINAAPCESLNLMPPTDRAYKYESPPWLVSQDGYLIDIKPRLHNGGLNMTFYVNGEKKCSSEAVYGGTDRSLMKNSQSVESITSYTGCSKPVEIKAGDSLTMDAYYDLTKHKLGSKSDNHGSEAEGMALANFVYARPYKRS